VTRYSPQWLQSGSYAASLDRRLIGALWPAPACTGCGVTPAGTGMDVHVDAGQVAVPTPNNTGTVLCTSDAVETLTLAPAPPAGTDRVDLVVCHPRSVDLDGVSNQEDFIFEIVAGAEGPPPGTPPATPAGTVALARVHVAGGAASIAAADVTDVRPFGLAVAGAQALPPPVTTDTIQTFTDADGEVWIAKASVYGGAWKRARDVVHAEVYRAAAWTVTDVIGPVTFDAVERDVLGLYDVGQQCFVVPVPGWYLIAASILANPVGTTQWATVGFHRNGVSVKVAQSSHTAPGPNNWPRPLVAGTVWCASGDRLVVVVQGSALMAGISGRDTSYAEVSYLGTG
jgi:hypothetical protein